MRDHGVLGGHGLGQDFREEVLDCLKTCGGRGHLGGLGVGAERGSRSSRDQTLTLIRESGIRVWWFSDLVGVAELRS